jgi:hypothetical protein
MYSEINKEKKEMNQVETPEMFPKPKKQSQKRNLSLVPFIDWLQFYCISPAMESKEISEEQIFFQNLFPELAGTTPENKFQRFPANLAPAAIDVPRYKWGEQTIIVDDSLVLLYSGHGTRNHKYLYDAILDGEPVAEIAVVVSKSVYPPNWVDVKIKNHILYSDWYNVANEVMIRLHLKIKHITRLDIALDTNNQLAMETLQKFAKDEISTSGSYNLQKHYKNGRELNCISIGKLVSDKALKIYNKSEELKTSKKTYIYNSWIAAGLISPTETKPVWRYEIRLKRAALDKLKKFEPDRLVCPKYLLRIFNTMSRKMLDFRENVDKPTKSGKVYSWMRKKVALFNDVILHQAKAMPTRSAMPSNGIYRLLQAAKADFSRYMLELETKYIDTGIFTYLKAGRLSYFTRNIKRVVEDISKAFVGLQVGTNEAILRITERIQFYGLYELPPEKEHQIFKELGYQFNSYQAKQSNYIRAAGGLPLVE